MRSCSAADASSSARPTARNDSAARDGDCRIECLLRGRLYAGHRDVADLDARGLAYVVDLEHGQLADGRAQALLEVAAERFLVGEHKLERDLEPARRPAEARMVDHPGGEERHRGEQAGEDEAA